MATGATGQLGLALPVQGELSGTWGDTVNNGITQYTNIAIAATLTLTGDGAVTLANTTGDASASNITSTLAGAGTVTAQFAIVRITGTTTTKVITGPSYSKTYLVDNASSFAITFKASGQTGVSIAAGEEAIVFFNGTDYVKAASSVVSALTGTLPVANGGTGQTSYTDGQLLIGNTTGNTLTKTTLTAGSNITITNGSGAITIAASSGATAATPTVLGTVYGKQTTSGGTPYLTAYGYNAGLATTGVGCTAVGVGALTTNSSGANHTAIGYRALLNSTVNDNSTAVGFESMLTTTTGNECTALGYRSLYSQDSGYFNTAIGVQAAYNLTSGTSNTAVGHKSLFTNGIGEQNTALGFNALYSNSTASNSVAVGYQALYAATVANNVAVGAYALNAKTTATQVVAVGESAGRSGTTGSFGTYVGAEAGYNVTGVYNTAIGYRSINGAACTGGYNTAIGNSSLYSITSGQYNVAIGTEAGYSVTVGTQSVYIGAFAGANDPAAGQNTYIGYSAGKDQTSDGFNTYIGRFAGSITTAGAYGVALGDSAGKSCNRSVYVGFNAGYQCAGYSNAFIGYNEQTNATTAAGCVSIGSCRDTNSYVPAFNLTSEVNRISMGSTSTTNAYIQVAWTVVSDARDKMNFAPVPHGLDFVNQLNPVAFQFKEARDIEVPNGPVRYGFKAQEILALEGDAAVIIDNEHSDKLRYNGEALVPVLVKALQELNAKFEAYVLAHP